MSSSPGGALSKHARRTPTRFGLHVGRVGALAVSLGVGFAITSTSGVAYAGTESESAASSDSKNDGGASEGESPTSTGTGTGTGTDADADSEQSEQDNDESDGDDASTPDIDDSETDPIDGDDEEGDDSDAGDPSDTDTVVEEEPTDYEGSVGDAPPPASEADRDVPVETPHQPPDSAGETPVDDGPSIDEADESSTMIDDEAGVSTGAGSGTEVVDLGSTVPASVETGTVATDPATGSSVESVDILTTVVSSVLAPFSDPAIPARAPWFDALLAWVRRQIRHTFFNESPEWGPATSQQLLTGQVLLDLKARDPDGDPLTFTIVQPKYGLVVRDPITGNFIYTPNTVVTGAPLVDNFKVTISDSSEHLTGLCGVIQGVFHFLARAIGLAEPDEVTLMVPVTVNPIVEMAPILVVTPVAAGTAGDEIRVSPVVVITDLDSNTLTSATVTLDDAESGQSLDYGELPSGVTASYAEGVLTFSGAATVQAYQQLLASVTLTTTTAALTTVSFRVVDDQENESLPAVTVVTVVGLPVELPPLVIVSPVAAGAAGSPITISPIVVITDLDSQEIHSATVTLDDPSPGDVLAWGTVPSGIEVTTGHGSVTFTGSATVDEYEQLLQSVTLTSTTAALKSVSFTVVDSDGNQNTVPANTIVTVIGLPVEIPPLLIVSPVATGLAGTAIRITPIAVITDLDSEQIRSATVTVENAVIGDVLGYGAVPDGVVVSSGGGSVTFTGIASIDDFEQLLESITLTSAGPGIKTVSFTVTDVDGNTNVVPAGTVVTVVGLGPVEVSP
ncbi:Ig-like domain-containing protein, partial [Mycolicibacterium iranicum]|uniref:Ig-like domain-containing protein n=1 Tax=Mycolicibacterium iranicum TaxID=912594 RepID=UPI000467C6E6